MSTYLVEFFVQGLHGEPLLIYFAHVQASDNRAALVKATALYYGLGKRRRPRLKLAKRNSRENFLNTTENYGNIVN